MIPKTDVGLVDWCHLRMGDGYVYGTYFSALITEAIIQAKAKQYPSVYTAGYITRSRKWIGKLAGDCVGLIKGYYWYDPIANRVVYRLDNRPDTSADGMYYSGQRIGGKSSDQNFNKTWGYIGTIPEHPGMLVWRKGHIGVYIGKGDVIESRGVDYGVVMTRLADRAWTSWVMCPSITYGGESDMVLQKGCPDGQPVYNYQIICKKLGGQIGSFDDMVLVDAAGVPLKTGCDGSYGSTMVIVTNEFCKKYGLPQTTTGIVTDALMGKLNQALQDLETGITQAQYDQKVAELAQAEAQLEAEKLKSQQLWIMNDNQAKEIARLNTLVNNLKNQLAAMSIDLAKANITVKAYNELTGALATVFKHIPV